MRVRRPKVRQPTADASTLGELGKSQEVPSPLCLRTVHYVQMIEHLKDSRNEDEVNANTVRPAPGLLELQCLELLAAALSSVLGMPSVNDLRRDCNAA